MGRRRGRILQVSSQTGFVFKQKALVAGVDVDGLNATIGINSNGLHEAESILDSRDDALVVLLDGRGNDVSETPVQRRMQVSKAGRERSTQIIKRRCGVKVCRNKTRRVRATSVRTSVEAVDVVSTERRHLDAIDDFHRA